MSLNGTKCHRRLTHKHMRFIYTDFKYLTYWSYTGCGISMSKPDIWVIIEGIKEKISMAVQVENVHF